MRETFWACLAAMSALSLLFGLVLVLCLWSFDDTPREGWRSRWWALLTGYSLAAVFWPVLCALTVFALAKRAAERDKDEAAKLRKQIDKLVGELKAGQA